MAQEQSRVLLADDHVMFTDGIVRLLKDRFNVVATVTDGSLLAEAVKQHHPHAVLMDISMPGLSGMEALRRLRAQHAETRVVLLTMHADARLATEAFQLGAKGYVLKQSSGEELITALHAVLRGQTYVASALTDEVFTLMSNPETMRSVITSQQREVLRLLVRGERMKEIGSHLGLSPRTVETIKYEMMRRLNVHTTAELIRHAIERQLVEF